MRRRPLWRLRVGPILRVTLSAVRAAVLERQSLTRDLPRLALVVPKLRLVVADATRYDIKRFRPIINTIYLDSPRGVTR